jgi:Sigma-70, region 4
MSRLDELPPDQRAALSLLLRQHKSYAEVAQLLGIDERAVHDRAHAALAVLAPRQARELAPERRLEVGDYLLSQQPGVAERLRTRTFLSGSEPARVWAGEVAAELAPLSAGELPELPAVTAGAGAQPQRLQDLSAPAGQADVGRAPTPPAPPRASSRRGGALLLGAIVAAVIVGVVLLTGGSSHSKKSSTTGTAARNTSSAAKKSTTGPTVTARLALHSPDPASRSVGVVDVLSEGGKRAFFIEAQHLPRTKGFFYAIWLYNSHTSALPLSKSPAVGSTHRLAGGALLPSNAGEFREMLLTRETSSHPSHPGHVVLRGPFKLSE